MDVGDPPEHPCVAAIERLFHGYGQSPGLAPIQQDRLYRCQEETFLEACVHARGPDLLHTVECFPGKGFPDCYIFVGLVHPRAKIFEIVLVVKGGAVTDTQGLGVLDIVCESFGFGTIYTKANLFAFGREIL